MRRGFTNLSRNAIPTRPEPVMGLGYIALHAGDFSGATRHFLKAADLAHASPETKAEALLGAGRTALARGDTRAAGQHLRRAHALAQDPATVMWIENGLAVAAALDGDFEAAEAHYTAALRNPPSHPRITANFVRMLIASGNVDQAAHIYGKHRHSYWEDDDRNTLQHLVEKAGPPQSPPRRVDPATVAPGATMRSQSPARRVDPRLLLPWPATGAFSVTVEPPSTHAYTPNTGRTFRSGACSRR